MAEQALYLFEATRMAWGMLNRLRQGPWLLLIAMLGLASGLLQFQQSLRQGILAYPPTYDNVMYLIDAYNYTEALFTDGFGALFAKLAAYPPHAPISAALSVLGFVLLGIEDWAPNLAQIIGPVALLLIVNRLGQRHNRWLRLVAMLAILAAPVTNYLVPELRPDITWGFLLAGGISLALSREAVFTEHRALLFAGVLLGLGVLTKPTVLPVNSVLIGGTAIILIVLRLCMRVSGLLAQQNWMPLLGPTVLIPLPYFVFGWQPIARYIYLVVFAPNSDDWLLSKPGLFRDEALYYITGPGGERMLGLWIWAFLVLGAAAAVAAIIRRDKVGLLVGSGVLVAIVTSYVLIAIPRLKSPFFGTEFAYLVAFSAVRAFFYIAPTGRTVAANAVRVVLPALAVASSIATFHFVAGPIPRETMTSQMQDGAEWYATYDQIFRALAANGVTRGDVFVTNINDHLTPATLSWLNMRGQRSRVRFSNVIRCHVTSDYLTMLNRADAVLDVSAMAGREDLVPAADLDAMANRLRSDAMLDIKGHIEIGDRKLADLYVRRPVFGGFKALSGFGPDEIRTATAADGDYAREVKLACNAELVLAPKQVPFHWGEGPSSTFAITFPPSGHLILRATGSQPLQVSAPVDVSVDGKPGGHLTFEGQRQTTASLDLFGSPGPATVTFNYRRYLPPAGAETRSLALMLDGLRFDDVP